jgi:uncharacterized protein with HEPN domain
LKKLRDKLIHWYFEVDEEIVWKVVVDKLPEIKLRMQEILDQQAL